MSFIFDALRKSENERQRGTVPDIARVPLAAPQQHLPRWAVGCIALLGVCVAVLAGAWWQAERSSQAARADSLRVALPIPLTDPAPPDERLPAPAARPVTPAQSLPDDSAPTATSTAAADDETLALDAPADDDTLALDVPAVAAAAPSSAATAVPSRTPPATERRPLPSLAQLRSSGIEVPTLQLQLHSYSDNTANRFVFINGARYKEGERLDDGPQLLRITPDGAVLSQQGSDFLLRVE